MRGVARTCCVVHERKRAKREREGVAEGGGVRATIGIYTCKCGSTKRSYISVTLP